MSNPYSYQPSQPGSTGYSSAPPPYDAGREIKGPAIALVIVQGISTTCFALSIAFNLFLLASGASEFSSRESIGMEGASVVTFRLLFAVGLLIVNAATLAGSIQMLRRRNYSFAMFAAVVSVIPCLSGCYCVGIPFGIWSLVVLSKPEVKQAFD